MRPLLTSLIIATILLACGQAGAVQVGSAEFRATALPTLQTLQRGGVSLSEAVEQVRRQYKGRIISAVTKVNGKRETHVIKVLTKDGTVKTVNVPGKQRS